ncbi:ABC transporter ATP-binding protein [Pseudonocardia acaciae]|uniref:ABC transporter ATP-binding protein n=1 Tax=Pseudonocardia acaciae TaxID=551276 RepID=UPI00048C0E50|nr:ABC transporter ATP-binding protein [Pseudonocardia acaciae]
MTSQPVLDVQGLVKRFRMPRGTGGGVVHAVEGVDLTIGDGEIVGLVGESGSGKSTVGKCIVRLLEPDAGTVRLAGHDITHLSQRRLRPLRDQVHMVFQDPYSSLSPRMTVGAIVGEPMRRRHGLSSREAEPRTAELLEKVGLAADLRDRYPHELSGGQRQRVGLARSLGVDPRLLIADEPVSALDVSVQAAILNQLKDLQAELGFSCLFIAHDLSTVEYLCDRVAVMYLGRIVELGTRDEIFTSPKHPYTRSLLAAALTPDPAALRSRQRVVLTGDIPSPIDPPSGCPFHTRCPSVELPRCAEDPPTVSVAPDHWARCHFVTPAGAAPSMDVAGSPS